MSETKESSDKSGRQGGAKPAGAPPLGRSPAMCSRISATAARTSLGRRTRRRRKIATPGGDEQPARRDATPQRPGGASGTPTARPRHGYDRRPVCRPARWTSAPRRCCSRSAVRPRRQRSARSMMRSASASPPKRRSSSGLTRAAPARAGRTRHVVEEPPQPAVETAAPAAPVAPAAGAVAPVAPAAGPAAARPRDDRGQQRPPAARPGTGRGPATGTRSRCQGRRGPAKRWRRGASAAPASRRQGTDRGRGGRQQARQTGQRPEDPAQPDQGARGASHRAAG